MKKIEEILNEGKLEEFLKGKTVIYRKDLKDWDLNDYQIKKLVSIGKLEKIGHGTYQSKCATKDKKEDAFEKVREAFSKRDITRLYKSFENLELNEETIRKLYPLLLSGLISLQKEVESLKICLEKQEALKVTEEDLEEQTELEEESMIEEQVDALEDIDSPKEEQEPLIKEQIMSEEYYTEEEIKLTYEIYLDKIEHREYEQAHNYLQLYIKGCEYLGIPGDYYYNLFGIEKKLYEKKYPEETMEKRKALENNIKNHLKTNQVAKALTCYNQLRALDQEKNPYYDFMYIKILKKQREYKETLEISKKLCENFPLYPESYLELAYSYFYLGRYNQAIETIEDYFKYDMGENCKGDIFLASCYLRLGRLDKTEEVVMNAEKYLRPEMLPLFYSKMDNLQKKYMARYMEQYEVGEGMDEKLDAMANLDYQELYREQNTIIPYMCAFEDIFESSHNTEDIYNYIDSLELEQNGKMGVKLMASKFFAKEKIYRASRKCFNEVERYKEKDSSLKKQLENTRKELKLIKVKYK